MPLDGADQPDAGGGIAAVNRVDEALTLGTPRPIAAAALAGKTVNCRCTRSSIHPAPARRPRLLGVQVSGAGVLCRCRRASHESDRSLPGKDPPRKGPQAAPRPTDAHPLAPRLHGPDRAAADARRDCRVPRRQLAARLGASDRQAARLAALRRAMGTPLAGCGAVRRFQRLRARLTTGPTRGATATTSSAPSTRTRPTTLFSPSRSPATNSTGSPTTA